MSHVSELLENLRGHFDVDLQIEHIFFPHGYAKKMLIPAGHIMGQHRHATGHTSIYSGGPVIVRTDDNEIELPEGAGQMDMAAHVAHQIEAVGPVQWLCIWETDETDPEKIDASVIEGA